LAKVDGGWAVKTNLIDKKGQVYVAWVRENSETGKMEQSKDGTFQKKATEIDYKQQVDANNDGVALNAKTQQAINSGQVVKTGAFDLNQAAAALEKANQIERNYEEWKKDKTLPLPNVLTGEGSTPSAEQTIKISKLKVKPQFKL
jgi:hypothetical protein